LHERVKAVKRETPELGGVRSWRTRCSRGRLERTVTHSSWPCAASRFHGTRAWWHAEMSRMWASRRAFSRAWSLA
jgi:hypothetical protein